MPRLWQCLCLALALLVPGTFALQAQTTAPSEPPPAEQELYYPSTTRSSPRQNDAVDLSLWVQVIAILVLAGAGLWILAAKKGFTVGGRTFGPGDTGNLQILETRAIGQRQYLVIVAAEGQRLLLATGPQGTTFIKRLDEPEFPAVFEEPAAEEEPS
ncbi:MAG: flagellar biosynthetic protein FliO [Verrucomicrobiota bacterium JB022]|nr:flagellar biosynthetic protein FliO [Verrucomicrobiota bacterium JB022]